MGNAKLCPRRSRQAVCSAKDIPAKPQPTGRDAVCTVSPRNRQHVWDVPGVNLHCALCDEILFTTPLELAAALLDFLLETMADSHWIAGQAEQAGQGQAGYAIAARIQSAVCVGAAMIRPLDPMPEILYNKLQQVLLDFQVQAMHPTRSSPLKELERATLLHSKFLLELCFGFGRLSSMPTRLAVRLFSAMQVSDGLTIWSIVEELRSCMKRSWPQHKTSEGHRLQVACVVLRIYGLTSLLAGSSRILETLEKQSEYSVSSALEDMTTAAQALTMTESHQVSSFGSFGGKIDLREENDANMEVSWLVSWMVLQAAATLFCAKPCNAGQTQITAWSIKHARELATGPAASAVSLRAVSLLLSWRQKLEAVADGEETLVEVVKALSAASHYSTSQGSDYCKLMMGLIEMPSLILQLGRVRCTLHEREGLPSNCLICVPGMSDGNDKLPSSHDIVMKSADGLSPEQLPLEFLGVNGRSEEWPEDETSLMIRALKDQNRPEAVFTVHPGIILEGEDILMATMSLAAAKVRCTGLPNCIGFYSEDWPFEGDGPDGPDGDVRAEVDVHFKTAWKPRTMSTAKSGRTAVAYQKERASPLFTRRQGYALDGADLFVAEMTIEAAKRFCSDLENCMGFTLRGNCGDGPTLIHFKSGAKLVLDSTGVSTCYVFETESRSHALPADGAAFFQLMDGKEEAAESTEGHMEGTTGATSP